MNAPALSPLELAEQALRRVLSDSAQATALAGEALEAAAEAPEPAALAHGVLALVAFREGDPAEGERELAAAWACLGSGHAESRIGRLLRHVAGQWHRREGRLDAARGVLEPLHALAADRPLVDAYLTAGSLAIVVSMQGDDDQSLDLMYQALALARRSGEDALIVNALNNLGSSQTDLHNFEDARPMLEECLQGALRLGSRRQIVYAAGNLVQCLCLIGDAASALKITREQLVARIRPDDPPALQRDEEIAQALLDNGLVDEAEARLGGPMHVDTMSNEMATGRVWLGARIALARGRAAQALQLCLARRDALAAEGEEGTMAIDRVALLRVAAESADAVGEHALAYQLLEEAFAKHERLIGRAAHARRLSLQIEHRLRQAEWERDAAQQMATRLGALNATLQAQVAENERLQQQLRAQALEDPLTGLHNRRHLFEAGAKLLALMRRRGGPLSAVLVDLDHFKQVNDRHGHDAGDQVLREFAQLARRHLRTEDLLCRYGGEEFVLLMPGADAAQAATRTVELMARFQALRFVGAAGPFACAFSAGVAGWRGDGEELAPLLARADAALYEAKAGGRARVRSAPD